LELVATSLVNGTNATQKRCLPEPAGLIDGVSGLACIQDADGNIMRRRWIVQDPVLTESPPDAAFALRARKLRTDNAPTDAATPLEDATIQVAVSETGASVQAVVSYDEGLGWLVWRSDARVPVGTELAVTVSLDDPLPDGLDVEGSYEIRITG
jgi:hypothetical protein